MPLKKTYGDWTIDNPDEPVDPTEGRNAKIWATCACGNHKRVYRHLLRVGHSQSCGHRRHEWDYTLAPHNDGAIFKGARFGRLVVTTGETFTGNNLMVEVRCNHGDTNNKPPKTFTVAVVNLMSGDTKSCGCYKADNLRLRNRRPDPEPTDEELAAIEQETCA